MSEEKMKLAVGQIRKRRAQCLELAESAGDHEDYLVYSEKADVLKVTIDAIQEAMD